MRCSSGGSAPKISMPSSSAQATPSAILRLMPSFHQQRKSAGQFSSELHAYIWCINPSSDEPAWIDSKLRLAAWSEKSAESTTFRESQSLSWSIITKPMQRAYRTQPHDRCLVLTLDAAGDGCTASVWMGGDGRLARIWDQSGLASICFTAASRRFWAFVLCDTKEKSRVYQLVEQLIKLFSKHLESMYHFTTEHLHVCPFSFNKKR